MGAYERRKGLSLKLRPGDRVSWVGTVWVIASLDKRDFARGVSELKARAWASEDPSHHTTIDLLANDWKPA